MNQTPTRSSLKATTLALALAALPVLPIPALAAGLGKITVLSTLGQPLRAEVDISASAEEMTTLKARLAAPAAFEQAGLDYPSVLTGIQVSLEKRGDGRPYLALRSAQGINEPFLDLLLEMSWAAGRLQREYTFLLDPPEALQSGPAPQVSAPQLAPAVTPVAPVTTPPTTAPTAERLPQPAAPGKPAAKTEVPAASAAEPIRQEPAAPSTTPQPEPARYTVKAGDTLSKIALANMPADVSLDQMLVALFRSNPQAFSASNMNRLATGRILQLPDPASVAAIDATEAQRIVTAQSADFNAYRKRLAALASQAPATEAEAPSQSASGKITPEVTETAPPPVKGTDKLEVSRSAAATDKAPPSDAAARAAREEDRIAKDKALSDAQGRIQELDKNLSDMKALLALKSEGAAAAQAQAKPATDAKDPLKAIEEDVAAADARGADQPAASDAPPAAETATEAAPDTPSTESATPAAEGAATEPVAKPARKQAQPPPMEEEPADGGPSFIAENPELLAGAGAAIALLLGYLGFKQWRRRRDNGLALGPQTSGPSSQSEPSINSVFGNTVGGQIVDTGSSAMSSLETDFSVAGVDDSETSEGVDPIAEADVYMAYGRNAQAEEILLDALKTDPERHAIHLKLLEIYAARSSARQFEGIANQLYGQTQGQGEAWAQAARLGRELDPDNPLYQADANIAAPVPNDDGFDTYNPEATMVMPPLDLGTPATEEAFEAAPEETTDSLDFELDLGADDSTATTASSTAGDDEFDIDFDLEAATPDATDTPTALGAVEDAAVETTDSTAPASMLEFALDEPDAPTSTTAATAATDAVAVSDSDMAFEPDAAALTRSAAPSLASSGIDLSAISLELDEPGASAPLPELPPAHAGAVTDEHAADALAELPALDEVTTDTPDGLTDTSESLADHAPNDTADAPASAEVDTKLELANAYEEMGDLDGARELLQEVLNEGNAAQQAQARNKLAQLG